MSRRDQQDLLLDYLYDELSPADRQAFEQQMETDAALRAEVEAHRSTRLMLQRSATTEEAPVAIFNDLMRQARHAAAEMTEEKPGFFARFAAFLMQPAAATAALVVVLAVTGIYFARQQGGSTGDSTSTPATHTLADNRDYNDDDLDDFAAEAPPAPKAQPATERTGAAPATALADEKVAQEAAEADGLNVPTGNLDYGGRGAGAADDLDDEEVAAAPEAAQDGKLQAAQAEGEADDAAPEPTVDQLAEASDSPEKAEAKEQVAAAPIPTPSQARRVRAPVARKKTALRRSGNVEPAEPEVPLAVGSLAGFRQDDVKSEAQNEAQRDAPAAKPAQEKVAQKVVLQDTVQNKDAEKNAKTNQVEKERAQTTASTVAARDKSPADSAKGKKAENRRQLAQQSAAPERPLNLGKQDEDDAGRAQAQGEAETVAVVDREADARERRVSRVVRGDTANQPADGAAPQPSQVVYGGDGRPSRAAQPMPKKAAEPAPAAQKPVADVATDDGNVRGEAAPAEATKNGGKGATRPGKGSGYDRAMEHYRQRRYRKAITELEGYLDTNSGAANEAEAQAKLARSYVQTNRLREAAARYRELLKKHPNYGSRSTVLIELAGIESRMGNLETAHTLLEEAAKDKSVAAEAKARLAVIQRKLAERAKARAKSKAAQKKKSAKEPAKAAPAEPATTK